jgi:hypothetical protein
MLLKIGAGRPVIGCLPCFTGHQSCSFNVKKWGIAYMPWVESTEEGDQLRAARAKEEKKKKKRGTKTVQVASSSRLPLAGRRSAKRTDTYTPSISSSPSPAEDYPYTAKLPRITSSSVTAAASLAIHLEDLSVEQRRVYSIYYMVL